MRLPFRIVTIHFYIAIFLCLVLITCSYKDSVLSNKSPAEEESLEVKWQRTAMLEEDITLIPAVHKYLSIDNHKVYISLSTSPVRLPKIMQTLQTLDLKFVEAILLVLPTLYRNKSAYPDLSAVSAFNKLKILQPDKEWPQNWPEEDIGPVMKLLPAVEWVKQQTNDEESIVITIDDDIAYSKGMIGQLIKTAVLSDVVAGSRGINVKYWNIDPQRWPSTIITKNCTLEDISSCDVIEGFGAVAYKIKFIDSQEILKFSSLSEECKTSDDLVISFSLAKASIPRLMVANEYTTLLQLEYGFGADALHKEFGQHKNNQDMNAERYSRCLKRLEGV